MHDRTRRALCRFFFLAVVLLPTLSVAAWSIYANSGPGVASRQERWERRLGQLLGARVTVQSVRPVFPGTVQINQLRVTLPGDDHPLAVIGQLRVSRGQPLRVQMETIQVAADQLGYWVEWLERTTRRLDDGQIRLVAKQVVIEHASGKDTFTEVVGVIEGAEEGSQAIFNLWQDSLQGDPLALQLVHPPGDGGRHRWILQTGSRPLSVRLLASQLSPLARLGSQSLFDGQLTCVGGKEPSRVELVGQFQQVDLASLSGFPASGMLAGSGQLQVTRCRVLDGSCQFLDALLVSKEGSVDTAWLRATAQRWGTLPPQGGLARQSFSDLSCHLELDGNGIRIRGQQDGPAAGALIRQADRVLLAQPRVEWLSVAQLVELLVPASQEQLPATEHTARLLKAIEPPRLR
jgi:hypothetical protein